MAAAVAVLALGAAVADAEPAGGPAVRALEMRGLAAEGAALDLDDGEAHEVVVVALVVMNQDATVGLEYSACIATLCTGEDHAR